MQLPKVCWYQQVIYHVLVSDPNNNTILDEGPREVIYNDLPVVQISLADIEELRTMKSIVATATFDIAGLEISTQPLTAVKNVGKL